MLRTTGLGGALKIDIKKDGKGREEELRQSRCRQEKGLNAGAVST